MATASQVQAQQRFLNRRGRWIIFSLILILSLYLLAVAPVTTWFQQKDEMSAAEERYQVLAESNEQLKQRVQALQSDEEIARLARERYELVPEGTQAYAVMPPAQSAVVEVEEEEKNKGLWNKVGDSLTFWN